MKLHILKIAKTSKRFSSLAKLLLKLISKFKSRLTILKSCTIDELALGDGKQTQCSCFCLFFMTSMNESMLHKLSKITNQIIPLIKE